MAEAVYAIEDFPADELLWRIEWIGGVGYNANVPSDPLIDVCLAQLPVGETNQLSARSRSSQTRNALTEVFGRYSEFWNIPSCRLPPAFGAHELFCRSVRTKSHRDDAPLRRGRSCNQERAPKRNAPLCSRVHTALNSDDTLVALPLAGVTPPLFAYPGGSRTFPWANAESISPEQEREQKYPLDQHWSNAYVTQKLRFRESPPRDKWSE